MVYLGHRRFLHRFHPYRKLRKRFNGLPEQSTAPKALTGEDVYSRVKHINVILGKQQRKASEKNIWKKRSIFFDLPYWRSLDVRHSLDVMHVEKNVCDSLVSTLLHIPGKTKDGISARLDLVDMGIRERLHPRVMEDGKRAYMEPVTHTLSKVEKKSLCGCLYDIKVPQGYSSNLRKCVSMNDLKLVGMKSHDYHVLMQQLLPIAIRGIMKDELRATITRLSIFFNAICNKVIDIEKLDELENEGYIILSQLEMHFPPAFFDIMVHLIVHLVREVRLCGPVYLRWMYPFERYMKILKGYSKNPYRPEASIVERYVVEEAMEFCKDYLSGATIQSQHDEGISKGTRGIKLKNKPREEVLQAHLYILNNTEEVQPYIDEYRKSLKDMNPRKNDMQIANEQKKTFIKWFQETVLHKTGVSDTIEWLAWGPSFQVITWSSYDVNEYSFYTKDQDDRSSVQNSGVMVEAKSMHFSSSKDKNPVLASMAYYGVIEEIWEISYSKFKVALLKCKWVSNNAVVIDPKFGFVSVDLQRLGHRDEPFI
jgi:Domain of unknown function (DUF4218)/Transposase family tnp2/Domain of unknown function (DUF4216)